LPGPDRDRHELTTEERQRGYQHAIVDPVGKCGQDAAVMAWAWRKVRRFYRSRRRLAG
jgi:hypothetical protein